jgi:colicin import membrane protein
MIDGTRNRAWLFWGGLGLSLVIHVGLAAHLLSRAAQDFGATDLPTTAISVNIESSDILESVEESQANQSAPSSPWTAGEPIPAQEAESEKAETLTPTEPEKAETSPPLTETAEDQSAKEAARRSELAAQLEQQRIAEGALRRAAEAEREKQAAEQRARDKARQFTEDQAAREEREAEARETEKKHQATENQKKAEKQVRKKSGDHVSSAGASGSRGAKAATGRVSASQGTVGYYSGTVNAWIARNRPPAAGARGRVVVELAVSTSGQLTFARIVSSSGNQSLDQIALAAVRRSSPFPQPPPGSTPAQLRFTFPFRFE